MVREGGELRVQGMPRLTNLVQLPWRDDLPVGKYNKNKAVLDSVFNGTYSPGGFP